MLFYGHLKWSYALANGNAVARYAARIYRDEAMTQEASLYDRSDAATAVALSQPLIGDEKGFINVYAPTGVYWLKITSNSGAAYDASTAGLLTFPDQPQEDSVQIEDSMDRWRGLELFDPSAAYYGAKTDGVTNDRTAWTTALEDMGTLDSGVFLIPRGRSLLRPNGSGDTYYTFDHDPAHLPNPKLFTYGYDVRGYGPGASVIIQGADWGNPIWDMLGRHGVDNNLRLGPLAIGGFSYFGNGFTSNLIGGWQGRNCHYHDIYASDVKGTVINLTAHDDWRISNIYMLNCGDATRSKAPIMLQQSEEGGMYGVGRMRGGVMQDVWSIGSKDHGIWVEYPYRCRFERVRITGAALHGCMAIDPEDCLFDLYVEGSTFDGLHIQSRGFSTGSEVRGRYVGNVGGWGVNFFVGAVEQTHGPSKVDANFASNGLGDVNVPLDGAVMIAGGSMTAGAVNASPRPRWSTVVWPVVAGATYVPDASQADEFRLVATGGSPLTFTVGAPINTVVGQEFTITLANVSGAGFSPAVTWDGVFSFPSTGNTKTDPLNTKERSWRFRRASGPQMKCVGGSGGDL